ncbi:hypothetical protein [Pedobacter sp. GR22-6]|uniref:hypothetical protein n=1 Tax=Pedobacter sp. GR22-6 TaxID=3127957 RepID=UPI00307EF369
MSHTFHIPVLGLGYSIDTPLKIARFGISSVVSIVDDELTEQMRKFHTQLNGEVYVPIEKYTPDSRAKRITAYLNLLQKLVNKQLAGLKDSFENNPDFITYFKLLPDDHQLKNDFLEMQTIKDEKHRSEALQILKNKILPGSIDVNIMAKVDKANYSKSGEYLGDHYTDALAAIRGFANSELNSSVVLSAGLNPKLYSYMEQLDCFYPDASGVCNKHIILKVSDFRSAMIQAKILAKKGLWVSEFRVESGLNCGGHAFATDGFLLGPILEEFKSQRNALREELSNIYHTALHNKGLSPSYIPTQKITAQGGIGTAAEHDFLLNYYQLDAAGWGSPFLLVPEATNVDDKTMNALRSAKQDDFYLSNSSPLGVLFNNFKGSSAELQRLERIKKGTPGSPCKKKYLCTNTEFTSHPICTASREYQNLKIKSLQQMNLSKSNYELALQTVTDKTCLCEGLCASAYIRNGMIKARENDAVSICPGPNLAYFSGEYTLREMTDHIYGRQNLLKHVSRPNFFINELNLYLDYLKKEIAIELDGINVKRFNYYRKFKAQLLDGISYYKKLLPELSRYMGFSVYEMYSQLKKAEQELLLQPGLH